MNQHRWVNPLPQEESYPGVQCTSFDSPSMQVPVGYCIYLPPSYARADEASKSYPVVYHLHGGSPGNETQAVRGGLAGIVHTVMSSREIAPAIVVFVNGGAENTYNYPQKKSMGVDVLVNELIPHIDASYRSVADRRGRAIQGFSQGGRGATRIMFGHPELFVSAAPGGSGYAVEQIVAENDGYERDNRMPGLPVREFAPDENAYDRARQYVARGKQPPLKILLWLGTDDFNYAANLEYMGFLYALDIPFERLIVPGGGHNTGIFAAAGVDVMKFHQRNFEAE